MQPVTKNHKQTLLCFTGHKLKGLGITHLSDVIIQGILSILVMCVYSKSFNLSFYLILVNLELSMPIVVS